MGKLLRDPVWQFAGVVVGVIAVVVATIVSYNIFFLSQQKKALSVIFRSGSELVNVERGPIEGLDVTYEGQSIKSLSVITVQVENTGTEEIRLEDYVSPLRLVLPQGAVIADVSVVESSPVGIAEYFITIGNTLTLSAPLLNPDDYIVLQLVVLDSPEYIYASNISVEGRIAGVKEISIGYPDSYDPNPVAARITELIASPYVSLPAIVVLIVILVGESLTIAKRTQSTPGYLLSRSVRMWILAIVIGILIKVIFDRAVWAWFPNLFAAG